MDDLWPKVIIGAGIALYVGCQIWLHFFRRCLKCGGQVHLSKDSVDGNSTKTGILALWKGSGRHTEIWKCQNCGEIQKSWSWNRPEAASASKKDADLASASVPRWVFRISAAVGILVFLYILINGFTFSWGGQAWASASPLGGLILGPPFAFLAAGFVYVALAIAWGLYRIVIAFLGSVMSLFR